MRRGSCYGYSIESDLDLQYLRQRSADGTVMRVDAETRSEPAGELSFRWEEIPGKRTATLLYERSETAHDVMVGEVLFGVDTEPASVSMSLGRYPAQVAEALLWGTPMAVHMSLRGDLGIHASSVDIGGRAVVIAAAGMSGKTTLAAYLHSTGHRLLADDLTCCVPGKASVWPGPALLRMRPDSFSALNLGTGFSYGGKHYVNPGRSGPGDSLPIETIVFIEEGEIALDEVESTDAIQRLWPLTFLHGMSDAERVFAALADLLAAVPIKRLRRPLTYESLPRVASMMEDLVS